MLIEPSVLKLSFSLLMFINMCFSSCFRHFVYALSQNERGRFYFQGWHLNSLHLFSGISVGFVWRIYVVIEN